MGLFTLFLLTTLIFAAYSVDIQSDVSIITVTRTVDLLTQNVKVKLDYEIKNKGTTDVNYFLHLVTAEEAKNIAWISAYEGKKTSSRNLVSQVSVNGIPKEFIAYKIELLNLLAAASTASLNVEYVVTSFLTPYPTEISQAENQLVLYKGSANVPSAYSVTRETSNFKIGNAKPISFTEFSPSKVSGDKIVYGPYENLKPFTRNDVTIHYENNSPFLVAEVERIIEVSHWGNIAIEEHIEIVHKGAKLKGSFSRFDYQMDHRGGKQPVVKSFKTNLPKASTDIYYRDQIGNISTSLVYPRANRLEVELRPRFPLFGGWKTNYILGYNVPTKAFLNSKGSSFALKIRLLDHLFDNAFIEKLQVKVILPETCKGIKLVTPYSVKRLPDQVHKTYLDIVGRPVIVLEKDNLVDDHIQPFTVYYEFDRVNLLREPLITTLAFFTLFVVAIVFLRLDFTIGSKEPAHIKKD